MCFNNHSLTFFQINKHEKDVNFAHYDILCDFNAALCVIHGQTYKFIQLLFDKCLCVCCCFFNYYFYDDDDDRVIMCG